MHFPLGRLCSSPAGHRLPAPFPPVQVSDPSLSPSTAALCRPFPAVTPICLLCLPGRHPPTFYIIPLHGADACYCCVILVKYTEHTCPHLTQVAHSHVYATRNCAHYTASPWSSVLHAWSPASHLLSLCTCLSPLILETGSRPAPACFLRVRASQC